MEFANPLSAGTPTALPQNAIADFPAGTALGVGTVFPAAGQFYDVSAFAGVFIYTRNSNQAGAAGAELQVVFFDSNQNPVPPGGGGVGAYMHIVTPVAIPPLVNSDALYYVRCTGPWMQLIATHSVGAPTAQMRVYGTALAATHSGPVTLDDNGRELGIVNQAMGAVTITDERAVPSAGPAQLVAVPGLFTISSVSFVDWLDYAGAWRRLFENRWQGGAATPVGLYNWFQPNIWLPAAPYRVGFTSGGAGPQTPNVRLVAAGR